MHQNLFQNILLKNVSTENYDTSFDSQNLVEFIAQYGYNKVLTQEDNEETLPENIPEDYQTV